MTQINWKVRVKNTQFWITVLLAVGTPLFAYYGITGADLDTWESVFTLAKNALSNPYVLATIGVSVYNAVVDPTTRGVKDSSRALTYRKPGGGA